MNVRRFALYVLGVTLLSSTSANAQIRVDSRGFLDHYATNLAFYENEREFERNEEVTALYFALTGDGDWKSDRQLVRQAIDLDKGLLKKVRALEVPPEYASLKAHQAEVISLAIKAFEALNASGPRSKAFANANKVYQPVLSNYLQELISLASANKYVEADSESVAQLQTRSYDLDYPGRDEVRGFIQTQDYGHAYQRLLAIEPTTTNVLVRMGIADLSLKKRFDSILSLSGWKDRDSIGIAALESILNNGAYSPMLFDAWRKWRAIKQVEFGMSKTSDIPNDLYDSTRSSLMRKIADHIKATPDDHWGYLQYIQFQDAEIIHRFGPYEFGNQSAIERGILFYDSEE